MTTKPFLEVCDFYLQEKKLDNTEKTLSEKKAKFDLFFVLYFQLVSSFGWCKKLSRANEKVPLRGGAFSVAK